MSTGYDKLIESVKRDCTKDGNYFNPEGCDKESQRKCFHRYCTKFKWIIERAKHYAEKTGLDWEDILDAWESKRDYWYMNYYQESNQPEIKANSVRVFETVDEMLKSVGKEFRCPACGEITTYPYTCNSGKEMQEGKICDWKSYGLLGTLGKGIFVYCKDKLHGENIFMPVAWESEIKR